MSHGFRMCRECGGHGTVCRGPNDELCEECAGVGQVHDEPTPDLLSSVYCPRCGLGGSVWAGCTHWWHDDLPDKEQP